MSLASADRSQSEGAPTKMSNNSPRVQRTTSTAFNEGPQQKLEERFPVRPSSPWVELRQIAIEVCRRKLKQNDVGLAKWLLARPKVLEMIAKRPLCLDPTHAWVAHIDTCLRRILVTEATTAEELDRALHPDLAEAKEKRVRGTTSRTFNEGPRLKLEESFPVGPSSPSVELRPMAIEVCRRKLEQNDVGLAKWLVERSEILEMSEEGSLCLDSDHAGFAHLNLFLSLMKATVVTTAEAFHRELPPELAKVRERWVRLKADEGESMEVRGRARPNREGRYRAKMLVD